MRRRSLFLPLAALAVLAGATGSPPAQAFQDGFGGSGGAGGTGVFATNDFEIRIQTRPEKEGQDWPFLQKPMAETFFNRGRCECREPIKVRVDLTATGVPKVRGLQRGTVSVIAGTAECVDAQTSVRTGAEAAGKCKKLGNAQIPNLATAPLEIVTDVASIFAGGPSGGGCTAEGPQYFWLFVDTEPNDTPDLAGSGAPNLNIQLDGAAPPAPELTEVRGGNEALTVRWKAPVNSPGDFESYAVFCARGGQLPVFPNRFRAYHSSVAACGATVGPADGGAPADAGTARDGGTASAPAPVLTIAQQEMIDPMGRVVALPDGIVDLDPKFLCADRTRGTEARISILENGIPYVVGVASVDKHGNASQIVQGRLQVPIPTTDFYRGYRAVGGAADGGCAYGGGRVAGAGAGGALLITVVALAIRRRRRS